MPGTKHRFLLLGYTSYPEHKFQRRLRGESGAVVIEGEAGIGKSRLVEHFLHEARAALHRAAKKENLELATTSDSTE